MSKNNLKDVKKQGKLIEIESKIDKELEDTDIFDANGNYLSSYDTSQNNKVSTKTLDEKPNDI